MPGASPRCTPCRWAEGPRSGGLGRTKRSSSSSAQCLGADAVHELTYGPAPNAGAYADKAYNAAADEATILAETGMRLVPIRRANMCSNRWADKLTQRAHRTRIETLNSQVEAMGLQRLHARTNAGFELKVHAALVAVAITNAN